AFATKEGVYAEWCPNEKVALEVGVGASAAGSRVLATMKHVGVNVAADPLFTAAYTGVNGGLVLLAADDPGMHSSQNEQDSRFYALAARIPVFDPSDSQEAHDFTKAAFELSEQFDLPFMIRSTVRISHAKTPVEIGGPANFEPKPYEKDASKSNEQFQGLAKGKSVSVLIGPEGGFSEQEIANLTKHGFIRTSLGKRILRAETAAIYALSVIGYLLEDEKAI
ncbi:MAG: RsmE family RNA methyltransferase, partial [Lachnospiraceae bacterium]|nr:RsmE family RNA methyltransferase [Lachnospiraceae bacterium]